ncbi:MAG TPA: tetratricopeptide repeat protein [Thermomicrobiales bacterium]|nr:tetratricopeptide repeat protein [Thermomicrobiales bacterium]
MAKRSARSRRIAPLVVAALGIVAICSLVAAAVGPLAADFLGSQNAGPPTLEPPDDAPGQAGAYEDDLRTTVARDPGDAVAQISLARLLSLRGESSDAYDHYQQAIALDPANAPYRIDFGRALASGSHFPDAELQYQKAIAADPNNVEAHYWLGELYRRWQPPREADAAAQYGTAVALAPDSVSGRLAQTALQQMLGVPATPAATPAPNATS